MDGGIEKLEAVEQNQAKPKRSLVAEGESDLPF
jgi:hypothetical protein